MVDLGISPLTLLAVAAGFLTAAAAFALGVKFRYLNPELPQWMALIGFVIGFVCAPAVTASLAAIVVVFIAVQARKARRTISAKVDRYVDRLAVETGRQHRQRPFDVLLREAEEEHQRRLAAIHSADHPTKLRQQLLSAEDNRHKEVVVRLTSGEN